MPNKRRWSDDELRAAVASAASFAEVMRALGLSPRGGSHANVRRRVDVLALDTSHFLSASSLPCTPWTEADLRAAVAASSGYTDVLARLGLGTHGGLYQKVRRRVRALGLDTTHFTARPGPRSRQRPVRWTTTELEVAVASSTSVAGVLRKLGLIPAGGNYVHVQRRIRELGLSTAHFTGMGWNVGMRFRPSPPVPLDEVLVANRPASSHLLKKRLFRAGLKSPACEQCGWAARREIDGCIPVELDHRNGDPTDNRLENLRILCPNCHALQPTHRGLNKKSRRAAR